MGPTPRPQRLGGRGPKCRVRPSLPCGGCGTGSRGPRRGWAPVTSTQGPVHASKKSTHPRKPLSGGGGGQRLGCLRGCVGPSSCWLPAHSAIPAASVEPQPLKLASVCADKVGPQFTFALDIDQPAALARVTQALEDGARLLRHLKGKEARVSEAGRKAWGRDGGGRRRAACPPGGPGGMRWLDGPSPRQVVSPVGSHLDLPELSGALHSAGHVDRVPPDVVLRLPRPDHPRDHGPVVYA